MDNEKLSLPFAWTYHRTLSWRPISFGCLAQKLRHPINFQTSKITKIHDFPSFFCQQPTFQNWTRAKFCFHCQWLIFQSVFVWDAELHECDCGKNAVEGDENFQSGSVDGDKMCQFGANCAAFFEGCEAKGALIVTVLLKRRMQAIQFRLHLNF